MKTCRLCQRELPLTSFLLIRDKRKKRPYRYYCCLECHARKNRQWNADNKERAALNRKNYYHAHESFRLKISAYNDAYRKKHKKKMALYQKLYWLQNKRKLKKYQKRYHKLGYGLRPFDVKLDRYYSEKLRNGGTISPSEEWVEEWEKKAKENNSRIMEKYASPSAAPKESQERILSKHATL